MMSWMPCADGQRWRRRATLKVKENNELLADMKEQMLSMRKAVKQNYPQQEWISSGVQDKR